MRPARYERATRGELVHVDIKKLGRIPAGGGHRKLGRQAGNRKRHQCVGYAYLHHAVDDYSRLAYSEILEIERKETAASSWTRARAYFAGVGITVTEVITDNGSCYRSTAFRDTLQATDIKHGRTRAYRPTTSGKVEPFNRTLASEWAYAHTYGSDEARAGTYDTWLHHYNHHRPHTGIGGQRPSDRVHNLTGQYNLELTLECSPHGRRGRETAPLSNFASRHVRVFLREGTCSLSSSGPQNHRRTRAYRVQATFQNSPGQSCLAGNIIHRETNDLIPVLHDEFDQFKRVWFTQLSRRCGFNDESLRSGTEKRPQSVR